MHVPSHNWVGNGSTFQNFLPQVSLRHFFVHLNCDDNRRCVEARPRDFEAQLPDASIFHLNRQLKESLANESIEEDRVFKSNQCIGPEFEVDEEDVPVEGSHPKVVNVQVLNQLPQVGVEDVSEERVEHVEADFPAEFRCYLICIRI